MKPAGSLVVEDEFVRLAQTDLVPFITLGKTFMLPKGLLEQCSSSMKDEIANKGEVNIGAQRVIVCKEFREWLYSYPRGLRLGIGRDEVYALGIMAGLWGVSELKYDLQQLLDNEQDEPRKKQDEDWEAV
ncbi:hypothetical protein V502_02328 [Pseudogymnoascus sp. VKM F-4520 (FW-2644)]|nr:hypothetical protein V502_02328 [Pseudogymnoascus sp. VKM F-4520 (FW-2644)]